MLVVISGLDAGDDDVFGSYHGEGEGQEEERGVFGRGPGLFNSGGGGGLFDDVGEEGEEEQGRERGASGSKGSESSVSNKKGKL